MNHGSGGVRLKLWCFFLLAVGSLIYLLQYMQMLAPAAHDDEQWKNESALLALLSQQKQNQQNSCNYHISCYGKDGIGHQMEAKLSCLAVAAMLNWTYVHRPVEKLEHNQSPPKMEALFGMSDSIPALAARQLHALPYNRTTMRNKARNPLPWVGHCNEESWFDRQQQIQRDGTNTNDNNYCPKEDDGKIGVYSNDNCWDFFWCHVDQLPAVWKTDMVPTLRSAVLQSLAVSSIPRNREILRVALHMRMGDSGSRSANVNWCQHVLQQLIRATQQQPAIKSLELTIHSDASHKTIQQSLFLDSFHFLHLSIFGVDDAEGTIERVVSDMVTADILVTSDSSLSHAAALLRHGVVLHPDTDDRSRMVHLGWHMLRLRLQFIPLGRQLQQCVDPPPANVYAGCRQWAATDKAFWDQLVVQAITSVGESVGA